MNKPMLALCLGDVSPLTCTTLSRRPLKFNAKVSEHASDLTHAAVCQLMTLNCVPDISYLMRKTCISSSIHHCDSLDKVGNRSTLADPLTINFVKLAFASE